MDRNGNPAIGLIGMGAMGSRLAQRFLGEAYPVTVYNRTREKTAPLAEAGASIADTPQELARQCDVVLSMVSDDQAVANVMFGEQGVLAGIKRGRTIIELSTCSPAMGRCVYEAGQNQGAHVLEGAVSGSTPQAEQGALVVMIGGEREAFETQRHLLDVFGEKVFYMGQAGMGKLAKLVVNTIVGVGIQALAEALALGAKGGLEMDRVLDLLTATAAISPSQKSKLGAVQEGEYPVTFSVRLMLKDFGLVTQQAEELVVPMPATAAAMQMCAVEHAKGVEEDFSAVIRLMQELARPAALQQHSPDRAGVRSVR